MRIYYNVRDGIKLGKILIVVKEQVEDHYSQVQEAVKQEIKERIDRGENFSLITDEWTLMINLSLIRIRGSFTATAVFITMENHLQQNNGIEMLNHIFASTADGAAVLRQYGRLSEATYQGCYSHVLYLAV